METMLIIDTSSYLHKAYHSFGIRYKKNWVAIGIASHFKKLIDYYNPHYVVSAEDTRDNAFLRRKIYPKYKSNRHGNSDSVMSDEFEIAREYVEASGIRRIYANGYEADDVIAALTKKFKGKVKIIIVSGDKDLSQLVDSSSDVELHLNNGRGTCVLKHEELITEEDVITKYGVFPTKIPLLFSLIGDKSDCIPGCSGIHDKVAKELVNTYDSLDEIYDNIDSYDAHTRSCLRSNRNNVIVSETLATPLPIHIEETLGAFMRPKDIRKVIKFGLDVEPTILKILGLDGFTSTRLSEEYYALMNLLNGANNAYYSTGISPLSDVEFDKMLKELESLELRVGFKHPNSPTQNVGNSSSNSKTTKHAIPMLSLDNTYSPEELKKWMLSVQKQYNSHDVVFEVEWKWDGISLSLTYDKGRLTSAMTRGDGISGDVITENAKVLKNLPSVLNDPDFSDIIRGECMISNEDFAYINEERIKQGLDAFSNPRNAASIIHSGKNVDDVKQRRMSFKAFKIMNSVVDSNYDKLQLHGLLFDDSSTLELITVSTDIEYMINKYQYARNDLDFPTDGLVVSVVSKKIREELGDGLKYPRWAKAYKFDPKGAVTKLTNITWQVGKYGTLTPVAIIEPVEIAGSVISRSTLHNLDYIRSKDIHVGDMLMVVKSAEVIPKVSHVVSHTEDSRDVLVPEKCPVCGGSIITDGADLKCENVECPDRVKSSMLYAVSKRVLDIDGFGSSVIEYLYSKGIRHITEILDPTNTVIDEMRHEDGYGDTSVNKLQESITKIRNGVDLYRVLAALQIEGSGVTISKKIAEVNSVDNIISSEIEWNPTIGNVAKGAILEVLRSPNGINTFKRFLDNVKIINTLNRRKSNVLLGRSFCISGNLPSTKEKIETLIRENGGVMVSGVSKNLSYLICEDLGNSKPQKAKNLGIPVISYAEFLKMVK